MFLNLLSKVIHFFFRNNLLINHNFIKNNEIHIKIGGDHGGGSFKMCYQIANTNNPNSKENTIIFSTFEAKDYRANLKVGLNRFREQINSLQSMQWQ